MSNHTPTPWPALEVTTMPDKTKYCAECRWCRIDHIDKGYQCTHPEGLKDIVDMSPKSCHANRGIKGPCGENGQLWEPIK